jgi:hypothetical protein
MPQLIEGRQKVRRGIPDGVWILLHSGTRQDPIMGNWRLKKKE